MAHEFRSLAAAPREVLGNALVAGSAAAVILLLIIGYFLWRDRKLKKPKTALKAHPTQSAKSGEDER